ncbi:PepSY-associated TM helix domain-containing protein [Spirosoma oryzicola]|uniref:PepSY-associated TM helix domain-containing protein n=1 Tax=Spirosoma oryzicola TaxID=2898794 RepID=UPI001E3E9319|nr:PepSY-associated TM helix domain-containing protein [Spirosoma oryzicola]UHG92009.1 PepSY domain-containing protein [Spirosoma oryzicola]
MKAESLRKKKNWASHQKTWYGKWHVWLGLIAGTIILIVSLTGTILVYRDEIDQALNPKLFKAPAQGQKLSFGQITEQLKRDHPDWKPEFLFRAEGDNHENLPYRAHLEGKEPEREIFVNPYTGAVTGSRIHDSAFIDIVLEIHRTLLIPVVGRYVVGISALILVILTISGLRLWIPRQWKYLQSRLVIKRNASLSRQNYDLHQVLGLYSSPMVLLIALTGVVITFLTIIAPVMFLVSFEKPKSLAQILNNKSVYVKGAKPISIDSAVAIAQRAFPPKSEIRGVVFPDGVKGAYAVYGQGPYVTKTGDNNFLYVDQYSGKINFNTAVDLPNTGKMYLNWVTPIHYGTFGGSVTRVVAFIASLIPSILFITGLVIWWPRWKGKAKKKLRKRRTMSPVSDFESPPNPNQR